MGLLYLNSVSSGVVFTVLSPLSARRDADSRNQGGFTISNNNQLQARPGYFERAQDVDVRVQATSAPGIFVQTFTYVAAVCHAYIFFRVLLQLVFIHILKYMGAAEEQAV